MNRKNVVIGLAFVAFAGVLAYAVASSTGGVLSELFGKAVWYVPYAALVCGVRALLRARG